MLVSNRVCIIVALILASSTVLALTDGGDVLSNANELYEKAFDSYNSGDYENASIYVKAAAKNYSHILHYNGIADCDLLEDAINEKLALLYDAESYYNKSRTQYNNAFYENASYYANKSLVKYKTLNQSNYIRKVQELLDKIKDNIEKQEEADVHYERAVNFYNVDDLDNAERETDKAKKLYKEINWTQGVEKCEQLISDIEVRKGEPSRIEWLRRNVPIIILIAILLSFVILIFIAVILIQWEKNRKKK